MKLASAGLAAMALLVPAPAAPAQGGGAQAVDLYSTHDLPSGTVTRFTVTCPPGYVAVDGAVTTPDPAIRPLRDGPNPASQRAWDFGFINPVGAPDTMVTVRISCVKVVPPKGFVVKTAPPRTVVTRPKIVVQPFSERDLKLACEKAMAPVGSGTTYEKGFEPRARRAQADDPPRARLTASYPVPGGFELRVRNDDDEPVEVTAQVVCTQRRWLAVSRKRRNGKRRRRAHEIRVERRGLLDLTKLPGRVTPLEATCRNDFALLAGHEFPPDSTLDLLGAHPVGRNGLRWATFNFGSEPVSADYYAFCLDLQTRWRRVDRRGTARGGPKREPPGRP